MRETPEQYAERTGRAMPVTDVRVAGEILGTAPRALRPDEVVPTLFRDVGPQALGLFHDGALVDLEGPGSACIFMRDASLPGFTEVVRELGVLVILRPVSLGPWVSGQEGIWVAEKGRFPAPGELAFAPPHATGDLAALERTLDDVPDAAAMREALGGERYDQQVEDAKRRLRQYLEDWEQVERSSIPLRAILQGPSEERRAELGRILAGEGVTEKDLLANWFHLTRERRDEVRVRIAAISARVRPRT